jgi:hypothetical protein
MMPKSSTEMPFFIENGFRWDASRLGPRLSYACIEISDCNSVSFEELDCERGYISCR